MIVGVVDIGTNSMRLLIASEQGDIGRWVEVTGLGKGVDATGTLSAQGIQRSIEAFERFATLMAEHDVVRRDAIATSASRDARNREEFFDEAEQALGVRPRVISGDAEAAYAYAGAVSDADDGSVVSDIGGGSTEFVSSRGSTSVDIGSVRLSDRHLGRLPPGDSQVRSAVELIRELFEPVTVRTADRLIGVAGTWTSLSAISQDLAEYDREAVHGHVLGFGPLHSVVSELSTLSLEETAAIPSLDPARAPVILAGGLIALEVMELLEVEEAHVSEKDTLDGLAAELLDLR